MTPQLIEQLQKLGLNHNEARVYLALLELGQGTVTQISQKAQMNRTTGYDVLERVALYGLADRTIASGEKNKKVYIAEHPSRLKQFLENKKNAVEQRLREIPEILPDLQSLYKTELKPAIKFFEGRQGIKNIYRHTLEAKSTICSILDLSQYLPEFDQFGKDYVKERVKRKLKEQVLVLKTKKALKWYEAVYKNKALSQKHTEYRWLTQKFAFSPAAEVNIYDDIVMGVLFKPGENMAFEIQNASFANSLKIIFKMAWMRAQNI